MQGESMNQPRLYANKTGRSRGFSTLELLLVMVVSLVVAALAIPGFNQVRRTLRISGDARDLNGAINQAKLQAAADFTDARVYIDLTGTSPANPLAQFHVDVWNKGLNCWQTVGDMDPGPPVQPRCLGATSPVQYLSQGVCFATAPNCAGLPGAPPPNTQANGIQQGPQCDPPHGKKVGQAPSTACIEFNSRGFAIDVKTGVPNGNEAVYITDGTQVYGVTVGATGMSQVWANNIQNNANWYRK